MALEKLLFIDTNIWLDFYRSRGDVAASLLEHLDRISDRIIVTYQLEMEFKKNRHKAMKEGIQLLKEPDRIAPPAFFSDAQAVKGMDKAISEAKEQISRLKSKYPNVLANPAVHDPVFKSVHKIFHRTDDIVWKESDNSHHRIHRQALRRFLHGYPPRKDNDTSMGDALNWEWLIHCAKARRANIVLVSRDSDYGFSFGHKTYLNDHLRQEFSERLSRRRQLVLTTKLSEALKLFNVAVSAKEKADEARLIQERERQETMPGTAPDGVLISKILGDIISSSVSGATEFPDKDAGDDTPDEIKGTSPNPIEEEPELPSGKPQDPGNKG